MSINDLNVTSVTEMSTADNCIMETARTGTLAGHLAGFYRLDGIIINWNRIIKMTSSKLRNRRVRATNGNRENRTLVKLAHWNAGNKFWQNKLIEIEEMLLDKTPDLVFISEANLFDTVPDQE